jgi:uncharacterized membrane protein YdjX (TVP38/TMEM64 family)
MKKYYKRALILGIIIFLALALRYSSIATYVKFETLKAHREQLLAFVKGSYFLSLVLYILAYILVTAFALPVAAPLTLIGGFLFGAIVATCATNIGATIGATLTFLLFGYFLGDTVQEKYHEQLAAFNANIERYGANYLLLARLVVFVPFFLVNILAGLTRIPMTTFIWTTSLGIIPGSFVYAYAGTQIATINSVSDVFSLPVAFAFSALIALSIGSILVKHYLVKRRLIS